MQALAQSTGGRKDLEEFSILLLSGLYDSFAVLHISFTGDSSDRDVWLLCILTKMTKIMLRQCERTC